MSKFTWIGLAAVVGLATVAAALWGVSPQDEIAKLRGKRDAAQVSKSRTMPAPAVSVIRAEVADFTETVLITGTIVPREEILVAPEIEGLRILEVAADEGQTVKKGDVLARVE
ncbi:MAG: biotin/lipoyl-binding protein, partial [Hyphomicrobium sp.]